MVKIFIESTVQKKRSGLYSPFLSGYLTQHIYCMGLNNCPEMIKLV